MKKIEWFYEDEMELGEPNPQSNKIENHHLYKQMVKRVDGNMKECDGWFEIVLHNDVKIRYTYVYRPHRSLERKGESYMHVVMNKIKFEFDLDVFMDNYMPGYGPLLGAMAMYVEHVLGVRNHLKKA